MPCSLTTVGIAHLNDACRKRLPHQHCFMTSGVRALFESSLPELLKIVREYKEFTEDNDPYGEHDFGAFDFQGHRLFWKIDSYADSSLTFGADNPLSPNAARVITIMLANEY